jgi:DNA primase catalytic core
MKINKFYSNIKAARNEARKKLDILQVVTEHLGEAPSTSGQDKFWCCPFHGEKSPSFSVHPGMQIFKCFGCGVGGDVISFYKRMHGLTTQEALASLSEKYSIDLSQYERPPSEEEILRAYYISIMNTAAQVLSRNMFDNVAILEWYISDTGFDKETVAAYDIGYSESPDKLVAAIFDKIPQISHNDIEKLELSNKLMWTNSLVYPIKDLHGDVLRFYTKPLTPPSNFGGKYVGTSVSHPLFTNKLLFGLSNIKNELMNPNYQVRILEGQKAAIAARGVALTGTSIHDEQIALLKEIGVKTVNFCFDGDSAGRTASLKLLEKLNKLDGINVLVTKMPDGLQADQLVKAMGMHALDSLFQSAVSPIEYFVSERIPDSNIDIKSKYAILNELTDFFKSTSDFHIAVTTEYLSKAFGIDKDSLKFHIAELRSDESGLINRDVEHALLRGIILEPSRWSTVKQFVTDDKVFTTYHYQNLFNAIRFAHERMFTNGMHPEQMTVQSIRDEINLRFSHVHGLHTTLDNILSTEPKYTFDDALHRSVDLYKRRMGIEQARLFMSQLKDLNKQTTALVSDFRRTLISTIEVSNHGIGTPDRLVEEIEAELHERSLKSGAIIGYDFSNLRDVNGAIIPVQLGLCLALSGLQKGHQVVISANSGVGKSLMGLQMATAISICPNKQDQVPSLWIPLEMNRKELLMRIISLLTGIDNNKVQNANFTKEEALQVRAANDMIQAGSLYIQKPRTGNIYEIFSIIDEFRHKFGIRAVFLDYIQMVLAGPNERGMSREEVIGNASKIMKNAVAEELDMVSVCIAQQNRSNYVAGEVGSIENIGGSYQIAQDADDMIIIAAKTPEQIQENPNRGNRKVFIDKRRGGVSDIMIDAYLDDSKTRNLRFIECIKVEELMGLARGTKDGTQSKS